MPSGQDSDSTEFCWQRESPILLCLFSLSGILKTFFFSCPFCVLSIISYFSFCCPTKFFVLLNHLWQRILSLSEGTAKATLLSLKEFAMIWQRNEFFNCYSCVLKDRERRFFFSVGEGWEWQAKHLRICHQQHFEGDDLQRLPVPWSLPQLLAQLQNHGVPQDVRATLSPTKAHPVSGKWGRESQGRVKSQTRVRGSKAHRISLGA